VGPITRTVADAALLLKEIQGPDERDWSSLLPVTEPQIGGRSSRHDALRIAFSSTLGYARVDPIIASVVTDAVRRLGADWPGVEEVDSVCPDAGETFVAEFVAGVEARIATTPAITSELLDPPTLTAIEAFRTRPASWLARHQRLRLDHRYRLTRFFAEYDALITPTTPVSAWRIGSAVPPGFEDYPSWSFFTYPFNLTGQPAGTVPCGMTPDGMPVGLQIVVRPHCEPLLLALMVEAEAILGPERRCPAIQKVP
jgi:aspartyl-tRNA(Asn)/glutamyl-tRNA(Gln) amidotransferase subunit A